MSTGGSLPDGLSQRRLDKENAEKDNLKENAEKDKANQEKELMEQTIVGT